MSLSLKLRKYFTTCNYEMCQVTGGGRGLGKGLAMSLAQEGCKVAVADIDRESAEQTAAEIIDAGGVANVRYTNHNVVKVQNEIMS